METEILQPTEENIKKCAEIISGGGIVAFPTETVYGLGADAYNEDAAKKIYEAKGRPSDNPLIVHVANREQIDKVAHVTELAEKLIGKFMPGALTLVLRKRKDVPDSVTAGLDTVGVRMPSHKVCRAFLQACGCPVCAPSANKSGSPSPTVAEHVKSDLGGKIEYILDGGSCDIGLESTIIDVSSDKPKLLRAGGISRAALEKVCGCEIETVTSSSVALCPGMKYKHYSPLAEVFFSAYYDGMTDGINRQYDLLRECDIKTVILCLEGSAKSYGGRDVYVMGKSYEQYAHNLFAYLRRADDEKYGAVIAEGVPSDGVGEAIINRLVKSSGGKII